MVYTMTQVAEYPRMAGNVIEPVLTATVGSTIPTALTNPIEQGLSATQAGIDKSSELKR